MLGTALAYIALAFFMVRISFAAAIAAGEAGLSGGDCCCCAPAGAPARANPNTRPPADKILATLFIPNLPRLRPYGRSTTRIPCEPARVAIPARATKRPAWH